MALESSYLDNKIMKKIIKKSVNSVLNLLELEIRRKSRIEFEFGKEAVFDLNGKLSFSYLLSYLHGSLDDLFFIQVGANDGIMCDQIYDFVQRHQLAGIVIEPIDEYFQRLVKNYAANPNVTPCKRALHPTNKQQIVYRLSTDHPFNKDLDGIASFDREHLLKFQDPKTPVAWFAPNIDKYIIGEEVRCSNFEELFSEYKIEKIDLLQIDTEGFDYEILKMIDFDNIKPTIIRYEVSHLSKNDFDASIKLLLKHNYRIIDDRTDIIAISMASIEA